MPIEPISDAVANVLAYCGVMEKLHSEKWFVFRIPEGTAGRHYGQYGCCRASERKSYEDKGALFVDE